MAERYKLTKTFIDNIPLSPDKKIFYRDSVTIGFGVSVASSKVYFVEKRLPTGQNKRKTIGRHGVYTLEQARTEAKKLLQLIDQGIDPVKQKRQAKADYASDIESNKKIPTVNDAYIFYKTRKDLAPRSISAYDVCVNDYYKDWKDLKITQITEAMVIDRHLELSKRSPAQANLAAKFLRALFNHTAMRFKDENGQKLINSKNPVSVIQEEKAFNKIKRRKGYIRAEQLTDWAVCVATTYWAGNQNNNMHGYTNQDYLFLIILTGFRREEAETIEWKNIDLKYGTIKITDTKNGEDLLLPLGEMLWYILSERKKRAGSNRYVFPDQSGESHIVDRRIARERITEISGIEFTYHDLRRTFGSIANSLAIGSYTIKRLINHTLEDDDNDVTDSYIQVSFDDLRKAMNMIENVILSDKVKKLIKSRIYFEKGKRRNFAEDWENNIKKLNQDESI